MCGMRECVCVMYAKKIVVMTKYADREMIILNREINRQKEGPGTQEGKTRIDEAVTTGSGRCVSPPRGIMHGWQNRVAPRPLTPLTLLARVCGIRPWPLTPHLSPLHLALLAPLHAALLVPLHAALRPVPCPATPHPTQHPAPAGHTRDAPLLLGTLGGQPQIVQDRLLAPERGAAATAACSEEVGEETKEDEDGGGCGEAGDGAGGDAAGLL